VQGSQIGFWDWDLQTGQVKRNEHCAELLGCSLAESQLSVIQWVELIHPEDRPIIRLSLQDHLAGLVPSFQREYRISSKSGTYKMGF
jgi:PAS domain-containing protein